MSSFEESSNCFLDYKREPTWDDPDCLVDPHFARYVDTSFPDKTWTFCSRYLSGSDEESRLVASIRGSLLGIPVRESSGALFDDDNKTRGAFIVRSQMGTGKTSTLKSIMKSIDAIELELGRKLRIICLSSRVSFGYTLTEVLTPYGFQMYNMLVDDTKIHDVERLIVSMESLHRLQNPYHNKEMLYPDLLIWDEFTSGAIHVKSPTIKETGVLLDFIKETARSGATLYLYMDAFYDTDGIDIIKSLHPTTPIGVLWNMKRPARRGMLKFHFLESEYDAEVVAKIESCKNEWAREITASIAEKRDPIFDKQIVFCFMSKRALDNKIKYLSGCYPYLFTSSYICRIHSDCDADAARTTLSATTHWPRYIGIFYTSSVLVGTNYNTADRPDIIAAMKRAANRDDAAGVQEKMMKEICVDIFCSGMSQHPCAISLAQMMARTRVTGQKGVVHFLIPRNGDDPERFPVEKRRLKEYLDSTRCYMSDPQISQDSGYIRATTIVEPETGRRYVAHALEHNSLFVKFYIYAKLCANRSKMSFFSHLKSILDGFSETVFNSTVEQLAPMLFLASDEDQKKMEVENMITRAKRPREASGETCYAIAFERIVAQLKDDTLSFTQDVLRPFDMSIEEIKMRRTMNDELVYEIIKFLLYFGINDLPPRNDHPRMTLLRLLIFEVHPWFKDYHQIYEMMRIPADENCRKLLMSVRSGKKTDVGASVDKFRSLLLLLSFRKIFPQFVQDTDDGPVLAISTVTADHRELSYSTGHHLDYENNPMMHCSMTTPAVYDVIFGGIANAPSKIESKDSAHSKRCRLVKHLNFILDIVGFDYVLEKACAKISNVEATALGVRMPAGRASSRRPSTSIYVMKKRARDIACLYHYKAISERLCVTRSFERDVNLMFKQQVASSKGFTYEELYTMPMPAEDSVPLPPIDILRELPAIAPELIPVGCTDYYISRDPAYPMQPTKMPYLMDESPLGYEEESPSLSSSSFVSNRRKRPLDRNPLDTPSPISSYFSRSPR